MHQVCSHFFLQTKETNAGRKDLEDAGKVVPGREHAVFWNVRNSPIAHPVFSMGISYASGGKYLVAGRLASKKYAFFNKGIRIRIKLLSDFPQKAKRRVSILDFLERMQ